METATNASQTVKCEFENNKAGHIAPKLKFIQQQRHYIPMEMPPLKTSHEVVNTFEFVPMGFKVFEDPKRYEWVQQALVIENFRELMSEVALVLYVQMEAVCLVTLETLKSGARVIYLNYTFNPHFNDVMRKLGARYNWTRKAWTFDFSESVILDLAKPLNAYFSFVINLTEGAIYENRDESPKMLRPPFSGFQLSPYRLRVEASRIYDQFGLHTAKTVQVYSWGYMIPFHKEAVFDTYFPYLLLQIEHDEHKPCLILYSVLGEIHEDACFLTSNPGKQLIARYEDTCRTKLSPAMLPPSDPPYSPSESEKSQWHGDFKSYRCFDEFQAKFPDLKIFPLSDDYVHFWAQTIHVSSGSVAAFVRKEDVIGKAVARYFGASDDVLPVMFSRRYMDKSNPRSKTDQACVRILLCHEVAHCLVHIAFPGRELELHGVHWHAAFFLLLKSFSLASPTDDPSIVKAHNDHVGVVLRAKMQDDLARIREDGPVAKEEIVSMLRRFDDCLKDVPAPVVVGRSLALPT